MKKLRMVLMLILVGIVGISLLSLLLPEPADVEIKLYYSPSGTAVSLLDVLTAIGCSVLFLMALKSFKPELKPAYRLLALSTLVVGVGLLIFPYIEYYGLWENTWFNMSSYLQYLIGAPLMFFGIRMFYKRVGLKGVTAMPLVALVTILAVWTIHLFIPRIPGAVWTEFSERIYDLWMIIPIIPAVFYILSLSMVLRLRRVTGQGYAKAFGWLTAGLVFYTWLTVSVVVLDTIGYDNWYFNSRFMQLPAILGDLSFLTAGYFFNAIGHEPELRRSFLQRLFGARSSERVTSMDLITYVAQMASDQAKIDAYLDKMREITAHHQAGDALTGDEQKTLRDAYLAIEHSLVEEDTLRNFNKSQLRADVSKRFALDKNAEHTFWPSLLN